MSDDTSETKIASTSSHIKKIPAAIKDAEIQTASPFETLNAKLDLLLKAQNLEYKEQS